MKLVEFKQYQNVKRKLNKKKVAIAISIIVLVFMFCIVFGIYVGNRNFRVFMDKYILMKNISSEELPYIDIEMSYNVYVESFNKYIVVLQNNKMKMYTSSGDMIKELDIYINEPIFKSAGDGLIIAEKGGNKIYLVSSAGIVWEKTVDGQISRVDLNEDKYVSVVVTGTAYKSVIILYNELGKELFKTYISNNIVSDVTISKDSKNIGFSEINVNGALVESKVKVVDIGTSKITNIYDIDTDEIIVNLRYHKKGQLVCMTDKGIYKLKNEEKRRIINYDEIKNLTYSGIELENDIFKIVENIYGINNQTTNLEILDTDNEKQNLYVINGVAKEVYSDKDIIAVNIGSEVYFVKTNGWLIKKYTTNQEIREIVLSEKVAGIIYKDKIEFVSL